MSEEPIVVDVEPSQHSIPEVLALANETEVALLFYLKEWEAAHNLLAEAGYPAHEETEFGERVFVKMEERIRRLINDKQE